MTQSPKRFFGLDIHKEYFVAVGVNAQREIVFGPQRVSNYQLEGWIERGLTPEDAVVLEMTTNTYQFHDALSERVHSVIAVHPPHVALVTNVQVKTDKKAALALAQLHAAGMLTGVWIPPHEVRDLRSLIARREKMVRLSTIAKNRLHAMLHRHHLRLTEKPFAPEQRMWWESLPLSVTEQFLVHSDLDTLEFAQKQIAQVEEGLKKQSAEDERIPLLIQLPGVAMLTAITILAAIGDITRFPSAKKLVGYAGLGTRVHDSGMTHAAGRITKAGRRDLRRAMVNAANHAVVHHVHWRQEFERLEPHLGRSRAIVAIARKFLVTVWHVLTEQVADRFADPRDVATSLLRYAYTIGRRNRLQGQSVLSFTRDQLDRLGIGKDLQTIPWGSKTHLLPPSKLLALKE
ncbi:MAG: IS110 family transposase [Anaerolineae bacterium]|nr:IS110 family transposase [Anaerolineae bacterium]